MNTATVLYSFTGEVTTPNGARLTACGRIRAPAGYVPKAYEAAADATADLIRHRPNPSTGVKLVMIPGTVVFDGIAEAVNAACDVWGVTRAEIFGRAKPERITKPRFAVYSYLRTQCGLSFPEVARLMERTDHGTVINGVKKFKAWTETDPAMRAQVEEFNRRLGNA